VEHIAPLYAARVEHLVRADHISVHCRCGHVAEISVAVIREKLPDWFHVLDLPTMLRSERCGKKNSATVNARHALGP
jgi:hypothetical protein